MAIFGFNKKNEDNIAASREPVKREPTASIPPRTSVNINEFNDIENKTDLVGDIILKDVADTIDTVSEIDKIRNSDINFKLPYDITVLNTDNNEANVTQVTSEPNVENVIAPTVDTAEMISDSVNQENKNEFSNAPIVSAAEPKVTVPPQAVDTIEKKPEAKPEYSTIATLASSIAMEIAYDLTSRFITEPIVRLDIHAHDADLVNLINSNPNIKYLDASDCDLITDFSPIAHLKNLEQLDLSGCKQINNVAFLEGLTKLKVLNLGITGIENLDGFPSFPKLEILNLKMNKIRDLSGLHGCASIHELILWGCSSLYDISVIATFTELRVLDLDFCGLVKDISAVANLTKLMYMNLNATKIEDLSPIQNLVNLEIFSMDFCKLMMTEQNLSYFSKLTKMKFLGLRNRVIKNLSYFKNMTKLAELEISGNAISDLTPLENMTEMQVLNLSCNPSLVDLSPLHNMKKLKKLYINGAKTGTRITINMAIEDLSVLRHLTALECLECTCSNKLRNISAIRYCTKLNYVDLSDCVGITDVTGLRFCPDMEELYFENCTQIKDLSFIKYLKNMTRLTVVKTSFDRLSFSNFIGLLNLRDIVAGEGTLPIHKAIVDSVKFRKKITKISKKVIKEGDDD